MQVVGKQVDPCFFIFDLDFHLQQNLQGDFLNCPALQSIERQWGLLENLSVDLKVRNCLFEQLIAARFTK